MHVEVIAEGIQEGLHDVVVYPGADALYRIPAALQESFDNRKTSCRPVLLGYVLIKVAPYCVRKVNKNFLD